MSKIVNLISNKLFIKIPIFKNMHKFIFLNALIFSYVFNFAQAQNYDWFVSPFNTNSNKNEVVIPQTTSNIVNNNTGNNNYSSLNSNTNSQIQIPQNVVSVINAVAVRYSLNQSQVAALTQIARSYQYIFQNPPISRSNAYSLSVRDVAAINCASSRINGIALDYATEQIENASIDNQSKKNSYDSYTNFLDENTPNPQIVEACEDEYNSNNTNNNSNNNTNNNTSNFNNNNLVINLNGVVADANINSACVILTHFMKFGSKGSQVWPLQNFLMQNGYLEMYPTGFFGRNTEFAVKEWQKRHGLEIKGWTGPNTRGTIAGASCKTQNAYNRAYKGVTYVDSAMKQVLAKIPIIKSENKDNQFSIDNEKEIPIKNTNNLSLSSGTFFLKRNPVNLLYFTYKANTSADDVYICTSKDGESRCESSGNFEKVKQKYDNRNIDIINNNTKWIFNVYYNTDNFTANGGKIFIRNGIGNISEVYAVKVADSL